MIARRYAAAVTVVVVALVLLPPPAAATLRIPCDDSEYTANGTFQANLDPLAAALPANASASPAGFATATAGAAPDEANALALCRGDTNDTACVAAAFVDAQQGCPLDKGVAVYRDACVLRFAGIRFLDFLQGDQWLVSELIPVVDTATGSANALEAWFSAAVSGIFTALVDRAAAASNSTTRKYFATAEMGFDPKLYGLAQYVPDLTPAQCRDCLGQLFRVTEQRYLSVRPLSQWSSSFLVWCSLRYSVSPFYDGRAMLQLAAPPAPSPDATMAPPNPERGAGRNRSAAGISAGVACSVVFMFLLSVCLFFRFRRRIKATGNDHPLEKIGRAHCTIFDLPTLQQATEHFAEKNKLGEGGFGTVYKGILSDGQVIAVKTLLGRTGHELQQLHNEAVLLAELQHKNLVRLQGFCSHQNDTLLVYEYIKNGSLDNFLFGKMHLTGSNSTTSDLKANNILLDDDMEPKIADFGLARLLEEGHTESRTARIVGTFGYMAPEYAMHGNVSPKIDIFSFGVLTLEIVTMRNNCTSDEHGTVNLLSDVWGHWTKGTISQMLHGSLDGYGRSQALRCIHVGLLCVQQDPGHRSDISAVANEIICS
ncbi:unnamed protein product [Urochloa decumbens]|uniref:Uncharacterized protein n=1 Tax=Urochloa decumbens TaxID=240449 RepID=A0ABC9FW83_9POAL